MPATSICHACRITEVPPSWAHIPEYPLHHFMGSRPRHFPRVRFRLAYDDASIWIEWRVEDRFVLAATEQHQGAVCRDSCVEFFFTPGPDPAIGYYNLEINCGGTMLFHAHPAGATDPILLSAGALDSVTVKASLPRWVRPEHREPLRWTLQCRLPFHVLNHMPFTRPEPGAVWRANFYKCADASSQPHWLTWAPVDFPTPRFHLPEFFGNVLFL